LNVCNSVIAIDSFVQHAWKAMGKKDGVILWGGTNPVNLGYSENSNLVNKSSCANLHCNRPNTHMFDFVGNGNYWKCPFGAKCMKFSKERLIKAIAESVESKEEMMPSGGPVPQQMAQMPPTNAPVDAEIVQPPPKKAKADAGVVKK